MKRKRAEESKAEPKPKRRRQDKFSPKKFGGRDADAGKKPKKKFTEFTHKKFGGRDADTGKKPKKKFSVNFNHKPNRGSKLKKNVAGIKEMKKHKFKPK